MSVYKITLEGGPIDLDVDDVVSAHDFVVERYVEASSAEEASALGLDLVRSDPKLMRSVGRDKLDSIEVIVSGVDAVPAERVPRVQPGFAFYPLEDAG